MMMMADSPLAGMTAVVTGASRGIGKAIAKRLAGGGARVALGARSLDTSTTGYEGTIHETADEIRAFGGTAETFQLDVSNHDSREAFAASAIKAFGRIDILVNNAGTATYKPIGEFRFDELMAQINTYLTGPMDLCNMIVPHMKAAGGGRILNIGSSSAARWPDKPPYQDFVKIRGHEVVYSTLKTAVHRFTVGLAAELYGSGITVNLVAPVRAVSTPGVMSLGMGFTPDHPMCELEEEIAEAALALVSNGDPMNTGQITWSYEYLEQLGRSTMSLDGKTVLVERKPVNEPA
jgi:3-oxoacyl-[acyl-carrier protein] reductase